MYIKNDRSELILSLIDKSVNIRTVVDLGCNDGATLSGLNFNKSLSAIDYHGIDYEITPSVINNNEISFHICDLNGELLEIKDLLKTSDLTLLLDVLEHLHKPEQFLERLSQIIKPSSQLVITVPNASSIRMLYAWLKKDFPRNDIGYFDRTHCSWFTTKSLSNITLSKFNYKKIGYIYSKNPVIKLLQKSFPARLASQFFILLTVR
jgi:2-polyprenyl-3-methyl-5-hydroxy-6-metoxy-1,4-benzoquinol methylase